MKISILSSIIFCCIMFSLSSCSSSSKAGKNASAITSSEWRLLNVKSANESEVLVPLTDKIPTLTISEDGQTSGFAGCNRFTGPVTVKENTVKFGNLALTRMMCMGSMDIESAMMSALGKVDNYTIQDGNLYLKKGSDILVVLSASK